VECRRAVLLAHFNEAFNPARCYGTCDTCALLQSPRPCLLLQSKSSPGAYMSAESCCPPAAEWHVQGIGDHCFLWHTTPPWDPHMHDRRGAVPAGARAAAAASSSSAT